MKNDADTTFEKRKSCTHRPSFLYYGKTSDPVQSSTCHGSSTILDFPCCQNNSSLQTSTLSWRQASEPFSWDRSTKVDSMEEEYKKSGWYRVIFRTGLAPVTREHRWPIVFTYIMVFFMIAIMSGEFMMNRELSGEFFEFDPFNPMLGPSTQTLIQSGARYIPCMRNTTAMPPDERYVCFSKPYASAQDGFAGSKDDDNQPEEDLRQLINPVLELSNRKMAVRSTCSLEDVCGMGGFLFETVPDQSFRLITPIFVHSGLIQLGCNLIPHVLIGVRVERIMNSLNLAFVYFFSGIFGNLFGANFNPITAQSTGCSSAVLGMTGCLFVDLVMTWHRLEQPIRYLTKLVIVTAFVFTLGFLPGTDNYSDIGGFIAGLLLGVLTVPALPRKTRRGTVFLWIARIIALGGFLALSIIMAKRFYAADDPDEFCPFCRYISCLPLRGQCDSSDLL
ncbi:hypothetical protein BJV82DRAFT_594292 [Fennellomyces sp. T-0311]|nr:hypothetical protein BJV82DRAFT_594292 [Fennellomyces sp. T-0311]